MAQFEDALTYYPFGSRNLRLTGPYMRGTDVKVLQTIYNEMLRIMRPPQGPMGSPITTDGILGPQTEQAVINVQSYFDLQVDGIVGPETFLAFDEPVGSNVSKGYGGPAFGSRTLSQGMTGGDVYALQNRLNCFRYAAMMNSPADGVYGPKTAQAVMAFQQDANANGDTGVAVDGIVGPDTFDALWIYTYAGNRDPKQGDRGFDIASIQLFLASKIGSDGRPYYEGHVDGWFGAQTAQAVKKWRLDNGLPTTNAALNSLDYQSFGYNNANPAPFPAPVPQF